MFYDHDFAPSLTMAGVQTKGATVFAYPVHDPERYNVVEFDANGWTISLKEKPSKPKSRYAVTVLYFYDYRMVKVARNLKPSPRGELEITDVNRQNLKGDGMRWMWW